MPRCPHCRTEVDSQMPVCPACRRELPEAISVPNRWISIGRLTNLAEAGYFADLLVDDEIECKVFQHDRFSALDGAWSAEYFLQVPAADAERAALCLRDELDRAIADEASPGSEDYGTKAYGGWGFESAGAGENPKAWKPLIICLLAGGMAYMAGQALLPRERREAQPRRPTLWHSLRELPAPLESPPQIGRSGYRLRFDDARDTMYLEEDQNGDGRYDRRQVFRRGQLVAEP